MNYIITTTSSIFFSLKIVLKLTACICEHSLRFEAISTFHYYSMPMTATARAADGP